MLGNAVKFTPKGGAITLEVKELRREQSLSTLHFTVSDTGPGLSEEEAKRLFQPFEQATAQTARRFGGTGLGLAISKSIIKKMGGTVGLHSSPGKGASFFFTVTLECDDAAAEEAARHDPGLAGLRLLLVENDDASAAYFSSIVKARRMTVNTAASLAQARALLAKHTYDAIFLTRHLPDATPEKTMSALRCERATPIIAVTTFTDWNRVEAAANDAGIAHFVPKPLFPTPILHALSTVTSHAAPLPESTEQGLAWDFSGVHLLLVEGLEINQEVSISLLEDTHTVIDVAENGKEALDLFTANPTRYHMIVMDGCTASRKIHKLDIPEAKTIPIIAMTASAFRDDIELSRQSGMNDHLTKPINMQALLATIAEYTQRPPVCDQ